ncbi:DMT family transporter [Planctomycetes bacterium K23_9]|uniref:EamA-like transporter family protein n=1 Tax=Stieleria marina TaxID=1930275 RepID=A0A517P1M1_9BACT|nr:EamA-like transporter family protein [Planctomycetes bacterium K23_9]
MTSRNRARWLIVLAALLWSTSGFFAKAPWFDDWPMETRGVALTFWRAVFAALTVLPFVRRPTFRFAMIPMSLCFTAMVYSFIVAMVAGSETTTIWLQYVGPAWVAVGGLLGLGDRPTQRDAVMLGLSVAGILVIVSMEFTVGGGSASSWPVGLALFSGLMYAGVMLSIRKLRGVNVAWIGMVNHVVCIVLLAPMVIGQTVVPHGFQWIALFALGAVQLAIPYMLFAWAVREIDSNEASLITLLEPMVVPLWTFLAWRNHTSYRYPDWWVVIGAGLIAVGFIWRYQIAKRTMTQKP